MESTVVSSQIRAAMKMLRSAIAACPDELWNREVQGHAAYGRSHLGDWTKLTSDDVFTKLDILAYCDHIDSHVAERVESTPFEAPSGFHWLKFSKAEAHLYNLRHIQHHAGQLIDRLRQEAGVGSKWVADSR